MQNIAQVVLKRGSGGPTYGRHPWIFSNAIERPDQILSEGAEVKVLGERGDFLGYGIFNPKSDIRVRMYSWKEDQPISKALWFEKVREAVELRTKLLKLDTAANAYRIIFSEGDGLSGLVVDRFADYLVVQMTSLAIFSKQAEIVEALIELLRPKGIYLRAEKNILKAEGVIADDKVLYGEIPTEPVEISEGGLKYLVDLRAGQKTGFYTDQRENRNLIKKFADGKRVLDLCTYTGAFAMNLAQAGAKEVVAIDSSEAAIETAKKNAQLNGLSQIDFRNADVFEFLAAEKSKFDLVVLDPPRFAPSKGSREKALKAYFKINGDALNCLAPQGLFMTFSCSHQIGRNDFNSTIVSVFRRAGRDARILYQGGQPGDHPILAACPETQYLKSLLCLLN